MSLPLGSQAEAAIERLKQHVDAMIVVSNDRLLDLVEEGTPLQEAFCVADDILRQGVVGISDIVRRTEGSAWSVPHGGTVEPASPVACGQSCRAAEL
jgi:hypothetical protein